MRRILDMAILVVGVAFCFLAFEKPVQNLYADITAESAVSGMTDVSFRDDVQRQLHPPEVVEEWRSIRAQTVSVNQDGVIFFKSAGKAEVCASVSDTSNVVVRHISPSVTLAMSPLRSICKRYRVKAGQIPSMTAESGECTPLPPDQCCTDVEYGKWRIWPPRERTVTLTGRCYGGKLPYWKSGGKPHS